MKIGYARVSRGRDDGSNTLENQTARLEEYGCARTYTDVAPGTAWKSRTGWNEMQSALREGDVVVVVALDRIGRDTMTVMQSLDDWHSQGVGVHVLNLPFDFSDIAGGGRLVGLIAAEFATMERAKIAERTRAGLAVARAKGRLTGKKYSFSRSQLRAAHRLRALGDSSAQIARGVGVSEQIVRRMLDLDPENVPNHKFAVGKEI